MERNRRRAAYLLLPGEDEDEPVMRRFEAVVVGAVRCGRRRIWLPGPRTSLGGRGRVWDPGSQFPAPRALCQARSRACGHCPAPPSRWPQEGGGCPRLPQWPSPSPTHRVTVHTFSASTPGTGGERGGALSTQAGRAADSDSQAGLGRAATGCHRGACRACLSRPQLRAWPDTRPLPTGTSALTRVCTWARLSGDTGDVPRGRRAAAVRVKAGPTGPSWLCALCSEAGGVT